MSRMCFVVVTNASIESVMMLQNRGLEEIWMGHPTMEVARHRVTYTTLQYVHSQIDRPRSSDKPFECGAPPR